MNARAGGSHRTSDPCNHLTPSLLDLSKRTTTKPSNAIGSKSANSRKLQFAALTVLLFVS